MNKLNLPELKVAFVNRLLLVFIYMTVMGLLNALGTDLGLLTFAVIAKIGMLTASIYFGVLVGLLIYINFKSK